MDAKPIYQSKTAVVNAVIALAPLIPSVQHWVQDNPGTTLVIVGLINMALRIITRGKVTLFGGDS